MSPLTIVFGGGKGGTGKSVLAASVGVCLAGEGLKVALVDGDATCPNLHTILGMDPPEGTLERVCRGTTRSALSAVLPTAIDGLGLVPGGWQGGNEPSTGEEADILIAALSRMPADVVIFDTRSGASWWSTTLFANADIGVLPLLPEPTSVENAYAFLRSVCQVRLGVESSPAEWPAELPVARAGRSASTGPSGSDEKAVELACLRVLVLMNQARVDKDRELGEDFAAACRRFLGIGAESAGWIDYDDRVWMSVKHRQPLVLDYPGSNVTESVTSLAGLLRAGIDPGSPG